LQGQGLRPARAARFVKSLSARLSERSERSERSEFRAGAARPSSTGDVARRATHEPQSERSTPPGRGFARPVAAQRTANDRIGPTAVFQRIAAYLAHRFA